MAPCAADRLMTRPSPGLRPPSPGGRGISAEVWARRRLIEILLPPGEGARSADEGRAILSRPGRLRGFGQAFAADCVLRRPRECHDIFDVIESRRSAAKDPYRRVRRTQFLRVLR